MKLPQLPGVIEGVSKLQSVSVVPADGQDAVAKATSAVAGIETSATAAPKSMLPRNRWARMRVLSMKISERRTGLKLRKLAVSSASSLVRLAVGLAPWDCGRGGQRHKTRRHGDPWSGFGDWRSEQRCQPEQLARNQQHAQSKRGLS